MNLETALSRLPVRKITVVLAVVSAFFTAVGVVIKILSSGQTRQYTWTHMFALNDVVTMPWWFRAGILLVCGLLLWLIGSSRAPQDRFARHWKFLTWVFVFLSADENATIHETFGSWISNHSAESMRVYAWLMPGIAFVIYVAISSRKWLRHLPPSILCGE